MPWVRIDENAMDHPKIGALSDGAFRLWVQGLAYCQKYLTDGFISDLAIRGLGAYSSKRRDVLNLSGLWEPSAAPVGVNVHDYLVWNDSKARVLAARERGRERIRKLRGKNGNGVTPREQTANVLGGVECNDSGSSEVMERGVGKTTPQARASAFADWYADTHERLFGIGYMGTNADWQKILELCAKFTDKQLRDGALVWFGLDDDFATRGTRSIPKFATRISGCLQDAKARGLA